MHYDFSVQIAMTVMDFKNSVSELETHQAGKEFTSQIICLCRLEVSPEN